jgi:plastocyanin
VHLLLGRDRASEPQPPPTMPRGNLLRPLLLAGAISLLDFAQAAGIAVPPGLALADQPHLVRQRQFQCQKMCSVKHGTTAGQGELFSACVSGCACAGKTCAEWCTTGNEYDADVINPTTTFTTTNLVFNGGSNPFVRYKYTTYSIDASLKLGLINSQASGSPFQGLAHVSACLGGCQSMDFCPELTGSYEDIPVAPMYKFSACESSNCCEDRSNQTFTSKVAPTFVVPFGRMGCSDRCCRQIVCQIDPACCGMEWNSRCAAYVNELEYCSPCDNGDEYIIATGVNPAGASAFSPKVKTIHTGATLWWIALGGLGGEAYNATSSKVKLNQQLRPGQCTEVADPILRSGNTDWHVYSHTFNSPGTYYFYDSNNCPGNEGTVIVKHPGTNPRRIRPFP